MVRVGGGWVALEEFLVKNDPCRAKGRTNIELREQFILADNVSQSMSAFKPKLSTERKTPTSNTGPITKVREKSTRSVPMTPGSRGSQSRGSIGSLSDVDTPLTSATPRKSSLRAPSSLTPGGSLPGSRSNSRPASRQGSKPPSRHGSSLSLASSDDGTPSRIPRRSVPSRTPSSASSSRKLTAPSTLNGTSSPSTRASKIPVYVGNSEVSSASSSGTPKSTSGRSTPKTSR
uniref:Microtubule-actin cross-linking factor 1 n=1 Tax=Lygus hesperus TaxID=30085 RepID=A0A0A9XGE3_LYGHE